MIVIKMKMQTVFLFAYILMNSSAFCGDEKGEELPNGNRQIKTFGPISLYETPQDRRVSAMQFQLNGHISDIKKIENALIFMFSGNLEITGNGSGPSGDFRNLRTDKWDVQGLPVRVQSWTASDRPWAAATLTFEQTVKLAENYANKKERIKIALKDLAVNFTDSGSVIWISASQAIIEKEE